MLEVSLTLDSWSTRAGESVPFHITLTNRTDFPLKEVPAPGSAFPTLVARSGLRERRASALTAASARGQQCCAHRGSPNTTILRNSKLDCSGDLLDWFGEVPPGDYMITAQYPVGLEVFESLPVPLHLAPVRVASAAVPRHAQRVATTPQPAASVARCGDERCWRLQLQCSGDPAESLLCVSGSIDPDVEQVHAGNLIRWPQPRGHVLWMPDARHVTTVTIDLPGRKEVSRRTCRLPHDSVLLGSAVTQPGGELWVPLAQIDGRCICVARFSADGESFLDLHLGDLGPCAAHACFWELEQFLHFAFASRDGYEVFCSTLPVASPSPRFSTIRSVMQSRSPVVWIEAYVDSKSALLELARRTRPVSVSTGDGGPAAPPAETGSGAPAASRPRNMLAVICQEPDRWICSRVDVTTGVANAEVAWPLGDLREPRIISGLVLPDMTLALLITDSEQRLFYATTETAQISPLPDTAIRASQFPALMAAGAAAEHPRVYLRYVDVGTHALRFLPLEVTAAPGTG